MNILRITIYTLIAMIFCIHSTAASEEVNPKILSTVQYYYDINLVKNRGCNWYQVLTAFGHEPDANPLGCSKEPYTAAMASNKPWSGWEPVRDELSRLEKLKAEEEIKPQQDSFDSWVQADNDRQGGPGAVAPASHDGDDLPEVFLICTSGRVTESLGRWSCQVYAGSPEEANKLKGSVIKYKVTQVSGGFRGVKEGVFTYTIPTNVSDNLLGALPFEWDNDSVVTSNSHVDLEIIPGNNYVVGGSIKVFSIVEDDREIEFSSAGCSDHNLETGRALEDSGFIICHFDISNTWHQPITVNYTISETGTNRITPSGLPADDPDTGDKDESKPKKKNGDIVEDRLSFTFPANKRVHSVKVASIKNNNRYENKSTVTVTLDKSDKAILTGRSEAVVDIYDDDTRSPGVWFERCTQVHGSEYLNARTVYYEGAPDREDPSCLVFSTVPGWPNLENPLNLKVSKSGAQRIMVVENPAFLGLDDFEDSITFTDEIRGNAAFQRVYVRDDVVNSGPTYVTFEILPGNQYTPIIGKTKITIEIREDDTDPQDIQIGMMEGDVCDTASNLEINEDGSTELCLKTNGFDRDTYINMILDQDEGGFIHDMKIGRNSAQKINISPATPNGQNKHITRGIFVPTKNNNRSGEDGSVRITLEGRTDGQYNTASKKAKVKDSGNSQGIIRIEYQHDPNVKQPEDNLGFRVWPPNDFKKPLKIGFSCSGYKYTCWQEFTIKNKGQLIKLDADQDDQVEIPLDVTFEVTQGDYKIAEEYINQTIAVRDDDPTVVRFAENSMSREGISEGPFTVISQFSIDKPHPVNFEHAQMVFNFPLNANSGCYTYDFDEEGGLASKTAPGGKLPCRVKVVHPDKHKVTKLSPDSYRIDGSINNGFSVHFQVGQDNDTIDNDIKFRPRVKFLNSGGGVDVSNIPETIKVYDDDVPDRGYVLDDNGNKALAVLDFTLANYTVVEENGPAQPVIRVTKCRDLTNTRDVRCTRPIVNLTPIVVEVIPGTAKRGEDYTISNPHLVNINNLSNIDDPDSAFVELNWPARLRNPSVTFSINTVHDGAVEGDEYFDIKIVEELLPQGFIVGNTGKARFKLRDSDKGYRNEYIFASNNNENYKDDLKKYIRGLPHAELPSSNWGYDRPESPWVDNEADTTPLSATNRYLWRAERRIEGTESPGDSVDVGGGYWDPNAIIKVKVYNKPDQTVNSEADGELIDGHPEGGNICPKDSTEAECPLKITINSAINSIDEDSSITKGALNLLRFSISLTSNRDITSDKEIDLTTENAIGNLLPSTGAPGKITLEEPIKAGIPVNQNLQIDLTGHYQLNTSFTHRQIRVKLTGPEAIKGNEPLIWVTNDNKADVKVKLPSGSTGDWSTDLDINNTFIVGLDNTLGSHQVLQLPLKITDPSDADLPVEDYELKLINPKNNIYLTRNQSGEYTLTFKGVDNNVQYNCSGDLINSSSQACIKFINKKAMSSTDDEYTVKITIDDSVESYGTTRGLVFEKASTDHTVSKKINYVANPVATSNPCAQGVEQCIQIVQPDGTDTAKEPVPKSGVSNSQFQSYVDIPFDVIIKPAPKETVHFGVCLKSDSTADYYQDFRFISKYEHDNGSLTSGYAMAGNPPCTISYGFRTYKEVTRYYLRVHGDSVDEGSEIINAYIKVISPGRVKPVGTQPLGDITTWTINNDGPMPAEYLARSGHAKAAHIVDIVKGRVSQPVEREPSVKIVPGGSPGDTDPDVILEGAIIEATTRGGITIYTDLSRLNFSGDVGLKGDIKAITIGADKRWENHLLGVGFTTFKSHGEYTGGKLSEKSWAAYPYGAYYTHRLTIYGLLAFGEGSMILNPNTHKDLTPEEIGADTTWRSYALGLEYRLFENERISSSVFIDHFDQTNKSKTVKGSMEDAEVSTYRTRAGLDTTLTFSDSFSSTFTTSFNKDSFEDVHLSFGTSLNYQMNEKTNISARWNKDGDFSSYGIGLGYTIAPGVTSKVDIDDSGDTKVGVQGNLSF